MMFNMKAKEYLAREIQIYRDGWNLSRDGFKEELFELSGSVPIPIQGGYAETERCLREDGTIVKRQKIYRNCNWINEKPEDFSRAIYSPDGVNWLLGDPEYSEYMEIDENEYPRFIQIAVERLRILDEEAKELALS